MQQAAQGRSKMFAVILVQACRTHVSVVRSECCQHVERAVTVVLELLSLNLTGPHQLDGRRPLQDLQIGLLIHGDDHFTSPPQALDPLVIPENSKGARHGFLIPDGCLPSARAMRLNIGRTQEIANGGVMNTVNNFLLHRRLGQSAQRPMRDRPARRSRCTSGQVFNRLAIALGKKQAACPSAARLAERPVGPPAGSDHRPAKWSYGSGRLCSLRPGCARVGHRPTRSGRVVPRVAACDHLAPQREVQ